MISKIKIIFFSLLSLITVNASCQTDRFFLYNDVYRIIENFNIFGKVIDEQASAYKKNKIKTRTDKSDTGKASTIYYINKNGYITERVSNYPGSDNFPDRLIISYDSINRITCLRKVLSKGTFGYNTEFYYDDNRIGKIYHKTSRDTVYGIYYPVYNSDGLITGMKWGKDSKYNDLFLYDAMGRLISSQSNYGKGWVYHNTYEYRGDSVLIKTHEDNSHYSYISIYVIKNNYIVESGSINFNGCYIGTEETEKQKKPSGIQYFYDSKGLLSEVNSFGTVTPASRIYEYYP